MLPSFRVKFTLDEDAKCLPSFTIPQVLSSKKFGLQPPRGKRSGILPIAFGSIEVHRLAHLNWIGRRLNAC
jgi:hypothetical protein